MRKLMFIVILMTSLLVFVHFLPSVEKNSASANSSVVWPNIGFSPVVSGLSNPVDITNAGDDSGRLFVVEQSGRIKIIQNGSITGTFLDISGRVLAPPTGGTEQGLLSLVFPPGYGSGKNYFYVYYTNKSGNNQVSRFHLGANPDSANPNSEELIILFNHPTYTNHNGGQLAFGSDDYLYIGTGDGGGAGDPNNNAQNPNSWLGKLLRIDVEWNYSPPILNASRIFLPITMKSSAITSVEYRIPAGNPFANTPGYRPEIWALGMRNPWRFSFDRLNHDLWIGDVGQDTMEEVDYQPASSLGGENYGWNMYEGTNCYKLPCNPTGKSMPIATYIHSSGNCSITGGFVYRGTVYSGLQGIYFFADYCTGNLWGVQKESNNWITSLLPTGTSYNISSFGEDQSGEVYIADRKGGAIYHLVQTAAP